MKLLFTLLVAVLLVLPLAHCALLKNRTLVLLDNWVLRETHSIFFKMMREHGHDLTFKMADDSHLALAKYGDYLFDHLVLMAPSADEFGGSIDVKRIHQFIDDGGNVLLLANSRVTESIREIGSEAGVELDEEDSMVIDHHNFVPDKDGGRHTLIAACPHSIIDSDIIINKRPSASILYRGIGLVIDEENPLVINILHASSTAYTHNPAVPIKDYPLAVGKGVTLIAGLQARNNARVVFSGSIEVFSDDFINSPVQKAFSTKKSAKSGNSDLADSVIQWVFKEKGVLRYSGVTHHLKGETAPPEAYTIMNDVEYHMKIEIFENGQWLPYKGTDVQMEFVRIDPFVRTTMKNSNGRFSAKFKLPDVYGVYQFQVDYSKLGYTHLFSRTQVSVRPLEHTQYERFIPCAYPYYTSAFSMMAGLFIFSFVWIHFKDSSPGSTHPSGAAVAVPSAREKKTN